MSAESVESRKSWTRQCVCCGTSAATRSIPACWEHWNLLPEDLRSSIIKSAGRGDIKQYTDRLLEAVAHWRGIGAWRNKRDGTALPASSPAIPSTAAAVSRPRPEHNVISLDARGLIWAKRDSASAVPPPSAAPIAHPPALQRQTRIGDSSRALSIENALREILAHLTVQMTRHQEEAKLRPAAVRDPAAEASFFTPQYLASGRR